MARTDKDFKCHFSCLKSENLYLETEINGDKVEHKLRKD